LTAGNALYVGDSSRWRIAASEPNLSAAADVDMLWTVELLD